MKMISHIPFCCLSAILLFSLGTAKPVFNLQSLTQLLEEKSNAPYYTLEESGATGEGQNAQKPGFDAAGPEQPWDAEDATNSALEDNAIARFLKDVIRTSKRSWNRYKKGGHRSCFGVRLERIGSFSGMGC
ncbi:unnamed protein product [Boreogadus saida]|uniref:natriuretic peptide A-like n=1 Tax=Gadus macrocephalus TaxID=80720 RepID=UPI0028CBBF51|nr:natriuretic peptide A-like [Gadus macrocephalus]